MVSSSSKEDFGLFDILEAWEGRKMDYRILLNDPSYKFAIELMTAHALRNPLQPPPSIAIIEKVAKILLLPDNFDLKPIELPEWCFACGLPDPALYQPPSTKKKHDHSPEKPSSLSKDLSRELFGDSGNESASRRTSDESTIDTIEVDAATEEATMVTQETTSREKSEPSSFGVRYDIISAGDASAGEKADRLASIPNSDLSPTKRSLGAHMPGIWVKNTPVQHATPTKFNMGSANTLSAGHASARPNGVKTRDKEIVSAKMSLACQFPVLSAKRDMNTKTDLYITPTKEEDPESNFGNSLAKPSRQQRSQQSDPFIQKSITRELNSRPQVRLGLSGKPDNLLAYSEVPSPKNSKSRSKKRVRDPVFGGAPGETPSKVPRRSHTRKDNTRVMIPPQRTTREIREERKARRRALASRYTTGYTGTARERTERPGRKVLASDAMVETDEHDTPTTTQRAPASRDARRFVDQAREPLKTPGSANDVDVNSKPRASASRFSERTSQNATDPLKKALSNSSKKFTGQLSPTTRGFSGNLNRGSTPRPSSNLKRSSSSFGFSPGSERSISRSSSSPGRASAFKHKPSNSTPPKTVVSSPASVSSLRARARSAKVNAPKQSSAKITRDTFPDDTLKRLNTLPESPIARTIGKFQTFSSRSPASLASRITTPQVNLPDPFFVPGDSSSIPSELPRKVSIAGTGKSKNASKLTSLRPHWAGPGKNTKKSSPVESAVLSKNKAADFSTSEIPVGRGSQATHSHSSTSAQAQNSIHRAANGASSSSAPLNAPTGPRNPGYTHWNPNRDFNNRSFQQHRNLQASSNRPSLKPNNISIRRGPNNNANHRNNQASSRPSSVTAGRGGNSGNVERGMHGRIVSPSLARK